MYPVYNEETMQKEASNGIANLNSKYEKFAKILEDGRLSTDEDFLEKCIEDADEIVDNLSRPFTPSIPQKLQPSEYNLASYENILRFAEEVKRHEERFAHHLGVIALINIRKKELYDKALAELKSFVFTKGLEGIPMQFVDKIHKSRKFKELSFLQAYRKLREYAHFLK